MCGCKQGTCPGNCACGCRHTPPTVAELQAQIEGLQTVIAVRYERMERVLAMNGGLRAQVQQARQWVETCVDPVAVGAMRKQAMLDYLDGKRDVPDFEAIARTAEVGQ